MELSCLPTCHSGGLIRNICAPVFSGGSTVCCPNFDANLFWDVIQTLGESGPTWYYASPTMHQMILDVLERRPSVISKSQIRMICNAAGGLLPSLATRLRDTYGCIVLPSYGMTECMPISTPPVDYTLDRPGTSGISAGPELTILDYSDAYVEPGTVGRVCVRGEPLFPGYLKTDGTIDRSPFNKDGWFDTGDLGYMDADGYVYITGRSKEVINRGGELISPFEVENAILAAAGKESSPTFGRVTQVLAFSIPHDVLQEVVGVVIVGARNYPRVDLRTVQESVKDSLQQAKQPVFIVFIDDLPKKNNKVLRIRLAERLSLPTLTDKTAFTDRHWEAKCPPPDTDLKVPIFAWKSRTDINVVRQKLRNITPDEVACYVHYTAERNLEAFLAPDAWSNMAPPQPSLADWIKSEMFRTMDNYLVPQRIQCLPEPMPVDDRGRVDEAALDNLVKKLEAQQKQNLGQSIEGRIIAVFADILERRPRDIPADANFFDIGGDSLRAGKLLAALRTEFQIYMPVDTIFNNGSVPALADFVRNNMMDASGTQEKTEDLPGCTQTYSSKRFWLMLLQLSPLVVFYPLRRAFQWTLFMLCFSYLQNWPTNHSAPGRLLNLTLSITAARVATRLVAPWFGIAAKWLIIGRYKEGLYPMWGPYHTRWWLVQKIVDVTGLGFFSISNSTRVAYYRLMGAKIGRGVTIQDAQLGEWDLIEIQDGATLNKCLCRPFAGERNTSMYLGRILICRNASVGLASVVAPGTCVPENMCIGPNSSSWEIQDAAERNRNLQPSKIPRPHWLMSVFLTAPIAIAMWAFTLVPWLAGLIGLVITEPLNSKDPLYSILVWFAEGHRVGFHYLALVLRTFLSPFFAFAFVVALNGLLNLLFGRLGPSPVRCRGQVEKWRMSLMRTLMPVPRLHEMTELFGQHYEATSIALRMLGANVGKRIYWPGTGPSIGDYHLINIGNDVVFGSRSHMVTSDGLTSEMITVGDRAMIADRVTLLPGVIVGENTTLGSGAVTVRGKRYEAGATFVGSRGGDAVCLKRGATNVGQNELKDMNEKRLEMDLNGSRPYRGTPSPNPMHSPVSTKRNSLDMTDAKSFVDSIHIIVGKTDFSSKSGFSSPSGSTMSLVKLPMSQRKLQKKSNPRGLGSAATARAIDPDSASPFGRAFYLKLAPYHVFGQFTIFAYSSLIVVATAVYWNVPSISSIQIAARIFRAEGSALGQNNWFDAPSLFALSTVFISVLTTIQAVLALAIVVGSKWMLLGRRQPGNYDWDKSSYCQRWQLFLSIEKLRRHCFRGHGILGMLTGTHWIVMYFRALGAKIGDDCAVFANGRPTLYFTEPDLLTLGNRVVVDDASLVSHINTRGKFDLNRLEVGDRCVLRSGSRLLSGATMKADSCLLEHTLVMSGDTVGEGETMQGWPAEIYKGKRVLVR